ncbi:MAG TPA: hypothetical protein VFP19_02020 [Candidatus Limnocylindrales bacterium]|nr:hypothetical protein [Candidatus Limnocylindrales bacterium]
MPAQARRVVILYSHPLLGEGLAHLLGGDRDLTVDLVRVQDEEEAEAALTGCLADLCPDVVIVERSMGVKPIDLLRVAPAALLIDVGLDAGPSFTYRREELSPQPDEILRTIRRGFGGQAPHRRRRPPTAVPIETSLETPARS